MHILNEKVWDICSVGSIPPTKRRSNRTSKYVQLLHRLATDKNLHGVAITTTATKTEYRAMHIGFRAAAKKLELAKQCLDVKVSYRNGTVYVYIVR